MPDPRPRRCRQLLVGVTSLALVALSAPSAGAAECLTPVASDGNEAPCNPYLSSPSWAESHRNSYAQASSPFPGPQPGDEVSYEHHRGVLGAPVINNFTEPYADGGRAVWFSSVSFPDGESVYKADFETGEIIDIESKATRGEATDPNSGGVSGAYSILDAQNRLIVGRERKLDVFQDKVEGDRFSPIERSKVFTFPDEVFCGSRDKMVGLTMLWDGTIAFATELGVVGTVPGEPAQMKAKSIRSISLNGSSCQGASADDDNLDVVSNSIAADENGGIYVVTSRATYKFRWDGSDVEQVWRGSYNSGQSSGVRLGDGSGSTPSLMGTATGDDRFVVITDGQELMHLVLMWRDRIPADWKGLPGRPRRIACEIPVSFGDPNATESLSEQSVLVRGHSAVVVNNKLKNEDSFANLPPNARIIAAALAGQDPANAPYGLERFDWNQRKNKCSSRWANQEVSIPNGIPSMSTATGLIYGIGQRDGVWGLEGIDFETGESKLRVESSADVTDNSVYAATTVAPDGVIWTGTFLGYTIFRPAKAEPAPESLDLESLKRCRASAPRPLVGTDDGEVIRGTSSVDAILAREGPDTLIGRPGDDCLYSGGDQDIARGKRGDDLLFGGRGRDSLTGNGGDDRAFGGPARDRIRGGAGNDALKGRSGPDTLNGGRGSDLLVGSAGRDRLRGGGGMDELRGGSGSDVLRGGGGGGLLDCGAGRDKAIVASGAPTRLRQCERVIRR